MRSKQFMGVALAVFALAGCRVYPAFDVGYRVETVHATETADLSLLVHRFKEERPEREGQTTAKNLLLLVPLIPWVTVEHTRTDEVIMELATKHTLMFESPSIDAKTLRRQNRRFGYLKYSYPASIAADLKASKAARSITYRHDRPKDLAPYDYVLTGSLLREHYYETQSFYGLSAAGVLLAVLGVPIGEVGCVVEFELRLEDAKTGDVVWRRHVEEEVSEILWLYGNHFMPYTGKDSEQLVDALNNPVYQDPAATWRFPFQIIAGSDDTYLNPHSLYWWHFEALRLAMERVRPDLVSTLAGLAPAVKLAKTPKPPKRRAKTKRRTKRATGG